jgi:hypothetical protein
MKLHNLILFILLILRSPLMGAVTFQWDDQPPNTPTVDGYRIYQIIKTQPTPEGPEIITYQQAARVAPEIRTWTTDLATQGTVWTIRPYNIGGEGPDSTWIEIPAPPAQVPGFRTVSLVVESSPNLIKWGTLAVLHVTQQQKEQYFRLRF